MHLLHTSGGEERILHRDLKPSNVMLDEDLRAKVFIFLCMIF